MRPFLRRSLFFAAFGLVVAATLSSPRLRNRPLWDGLVPPISAATTKATYDLSQLRVANEVLRMVNERYVDPKRVKPREMFLSGLNFVQRDVPQIIVLHEEGAPSVRVRVDAKEKDFRVDNVIGPWDVSQRLREVFTFVQAELAGTDIDLKQIEYSACNGMLNTLDPHSILLNPEAFKDMSVSTSGQFGGLGIEIGLRDQMLTVVRPMPGTPAWRAGLKKYDRIQKIDGESTLNMGTTEAVNHLRGTPGSKVTVYIHRDGPDGWPGTRPFELTREVIKLKSVEHQQLDGNVGYVRIKGFQKTTTAELEQALSELKRSSGLVMDLRGNHGGLLDEAVKIVDKFVTSGPIVATVGAAEGRDERVAKEAGTEANYPLVVLVNSNSASASEIVAGSLKNHERAVIVGESTFGKGSVQIIFDNLPDKTGLKLTIAQYLTEPGDVSIQGTGIVPDIELDPMTVDDKELDLMVDNLGLRERDLSRSLSNARAREGQKPLELLRYNLTMRERQDWRDRGWDPDDTFVVDFPIKFARDLASKLAPGNSIEQVKSAKSFIHETRNAELAKVSADFKALGIDWTAPTEAPVGAFADKDLEVKVETDKANNLVRAGEPLSLKVTVTNKGVLPLYRLRATTKSDSGYFEHKELAFGKLEPGKSRVTTIPLGFCEPEGYKPGSTAVLPKDAPRICKIPKDAIARTDGIKLEFDEAFSHAPSSRETRVTVAPLDRPTFAYAYQLVDNRKANGDGFAQRGEGLSLYVTVKNVGKGKSYETQANVRNLSGDGILLHTGRFDLSNMDPGESRNVVFTFDVQQKLPDAEAKVELSVADRDLREVVVEKIKIPIRTPLAVAPATGFVRAKAAANVLEAPDAAARVVSRLLPDQRMTLRGKVEGFYRVQMEDERFGFIRTADVSETQGGELAKPAPLVSHAPPTIEITDVPLSSREPKITLRGVVSDSEKLTDAFVFVGSKKMFYRSNKNGADPKRMTFDAEIPLRPGANIVTVVARETAETTARRTLVIRRDGPSGELLETPKGDDDLGESFAGMDE